MGAAGILENSSIFFNYNVCTGVSPNFCQCLEIQFVLRILNLCFALTWRAYSASKNPSYQFSNDAICKDPCFMGLGIRTISSYYYDRCFPFKISCAINVKVFDQSWLKRYSCSMKKCSQPIKTSQLFLHSDMTMWQKFCYLNVVIKIMSHDYY